MMPMLVMIKQCGVFVCQCVNGLQDKMSGSGHSSHLYSMHHGVQKICMFWLVVLMAGSH